MRAEASRISEAVAALVARHYLKKPDQEELIRIKFPDLRSIAFGVLNELAFRLRLSRSFRLHTLNVEVTNRCNLRCVYCPVNRSLSRPKTDLDYDAFCDLIARAPTVRTLLPFQWGEPLLHPRMPEMIEFAARRGIRTFLTTNGTMLEPEMNLRLIRAGLERLTVSVDGPDEIHFATRGIDLAPIRARVAELVALRDRLGSGMRVDVSMVVDDQTADGIDAFRSAWTGVADRVQLIPRMIEGRRTSACREPWRGLLVVLADGRTTTCCADSEGVLDLGNALRDDPARIFSGCAMRRLRRAHRRGTLPAPCDRCEEYSHPAVSRRFR